ncbi:MAG TPA: peroxide stress protein YaaA [Pseudoflavonifractor sp.]|nr:peroxide stress protein YaaA [Pseudoflavonifractor sp.]
MRIILSPAKKMNVDTDSLLPAALPLFLPQAEAVKARLQGMSGKELQALWRCNDAIAALNVERLRGMDLRKNLAPALLAYEGIQYRYMAPGVFEGGQLDYVGERVRILSGFYGLLHPFDGVTPYRLEMQAKLSIGKSRDLYAYWGDKLARQLCTETGFILNLASQEYSRAVQPHLRPGVRFLTCTFAQRKDGKVLEKGTLCKMARGEMVRWLAEETVTDPDEIKGFTRLGYAYCGELSGVDHYVFIKKTAEKGAMEQ